MASAHLPADDRDSGLLWTNISFLLMWSSVAASGFGDRIMMLAAMALLGATGQDVEGTGVLAGITFFFFAPYLVMSIPGGWLADRLSRKWLMLACDEARALLLFLSFMLVPAAGVAVIPEDHHWKVFAIMACVGTFAALFNPVRNAVVPQIVPTRHLQSANALLIAITVIASLIGLLIGGLIIDPNEAASVRSGLFIGAMFYGVSGTFFAFLKIRPHRSGISPVPQRRQEPKATPYLLKHRAQVKLIVISMVVWGAAFVVYNAALALAKHRYGFEGEKQILEAFSQLGAALGAGMLFGAVWVAWMNTRRESGAIAMLALFFAAICTAVLARTTNFHLALGLAFGVGFFGNTTIICVTTLLQTLSPNYIRGRVMGVNSLLSTATNVAVNFIIWRLPNSDRLVLQTLDGIAVLLAVIAATGLWMEATRGPNLSRFLNVLWRIDRAFTLVWHRCRWIGKHNVPHEGPAILAPNHTTGLDPLLIQAGCPRRIRWLMLSSYRFRVLEFLWKRLEPIFLDRDQRDTARIREILRVLEAGELVTIFPEGGLQREHRELKPFQPGIGLIARRSGAPIIPVWIEGTPRTRHMLWHFLKPSRSMVAFGEPYIPDPSWSNEEIAADLRRRVLELAERVAGETHGAYTRPGA